LKTALHLHEEASEQEQGKISDTLDELEASEVSIDEVIERLQGESIRVIMA
tara:strand:+ start:221 stop:373 length:153 start_codon:yes stop_codon:yes gene_type:complete